MDNFRKFQKAECKDGAPNGGKRPYGCPCCRKIGDLNTFKKHTRRLARARLKNEDKRNEEG